MSMKASRAWPLKKHDQKDGESYGEGLAEGRV